MKHRFGPRKAALALAAITLGMCSGCAELLGLTSALSFGAGWFLRDLTVQTTVVRECYLNGEQVDCATLD